jgi:hypothetical protein
MIPPKAKVGAINSRRSRPYDAKHRIHNLLRANQLSRLRSTIQDGFIGRIHRIITLSKETAIRVCIDHDKRRQQCLEPRVGLVQMPFQIAAHPVEPPFVLRFDVPHPRNRRMSNRRLVLPVWANLEDVDGLSDYGEPNVQLRADVFRRAPLLHEPLQRLGIAGLLYFRECHR